MPGHQIFLRPSYGVPGILVSKSVHLVQRKVSRQHDHTEQFYIVFEMFLKHLKFILHLNIQVLDHGVVPACCIQQREGPTTQ